MGNVTSDQIKIWEHWIQTCYDEGRNLTKWEQGFIEDLKEQFENGRKYLSDRQAEILERIYADKTPT